MRHRRIPKYLQGENEDVVLVRSFFQDGGIDTLAELRNMASTRRIHLVGLDVEGQEGVSAGVNSIGVAACAAPDSRLLSGTPWHAEGPVDLSDIVKRHEVDAHVLVCASRPEKAKFEDFPFGEARQVEKNRVETLLVNRLNAMLGLDQSSEQSAEMVLVTWGCHNEFYAMSTLFSGLTRCFARWIDIGEVILGSMAPGSRLPSLRDTMLSMGFDRYDVQRGWTQKNHSPGMDAARVLGTLLQLWAKPPGWQMEVFPFRKQERESRKIWSRKPPPSTFPFMVRMTTKQQNAREISFLPDELGFGDRVFKFIKKNVAMPQAVAVCERKDRSAGGSVKKGNIAYACFADEESVALFLKWDGHQIGGKTLVLDNVSLVSDKDVSRTAGSLALPASTKSSTCLASP